MAAQQRPPLRRALEGASQLRPFLLPNVRTTGKELGGGSYGVVEELEMDGLVCAGKKIYDTLVDPENQGAQRMVEKYYSECSLLSELRHPHIVQFLGICFLPGSQLPVLVMERLHGSLDELLETTPDIPVSMKLSILQDVARGLVFLHNRNPVVIHRDLTARNVLLNTAMTAKIADLGNSRIVNLRPGKLAQTMTQGIPGTLVYMPPEALGSTQRYGPSLDMFSFGHLALFTAIQIFPGDLLAPTYQDPKTREIKARSELQRRQEYVATLETNFGKKHSLVKLIKECLEYESCARPTARQALDRLGLLRASHLDPYLHMNRLQLEKALTQRDAEPGKHLAQKTLQQQEKWSDRNCDIEEAKLAEQAERYEDMLKAMKAAVEKKSSLSVEERNLFSVAQKNVIGPKRSAWRVLSAIEGKEKDDSERMKVVRRSLTAVKSELVALCSGVVDTVDKHLLPEAVSTENKVFFMKMKGDLYRFMAEVATKDEKDAVARSSRKAYNDASNLSTASLPPTNPVRLGLALNFSVFYYEIENNPSKACTLAKEAFDYAIATLDVLTEDNYKDSTLIMQLLRDNLVLWTNDNTK